jgi:small subunit ribosomal protein S11
MQDDSVKKEEAVEVKAEPKSDSDVPAIAVSEEGDNFDSASLGTPLSEDTGSDKVARDKGARSGLVELPESVRIKLEKQKEARTKKVKKRKTKKVKDRKVTIGKAFIKSTYNNTIITLTDLNGNVLTWASAGIAGFKGPKKSTPYASQVITRIAVERARDQYGLDEVSVFVRGVGTGREAAVRALHANGLNVTTIKDITPIPHNGCRPKKPRRV